MPESKPTTETQNQRYNVTATTPDGQEFRYNVCCERDFATRVGLLAEAGLKRFILDQPPEMPRACEEHAYTPFGNP